MSVDPHSDHTAETLAANLTGQQIVEHPVERLWKQFGTITRFDGNDVNWACDLTVTRTGRVFVDRNDPNNVSDVAWNQSEWSITAHNVDDRIAFAVVGTTVDVTVMTVASHSGSVYVTGYRTDPVSQLDMIGVGRLHGWQQDQWLR